MSPVSRRTGRAYAAGSQAVFDGYPRVCAAGESCQHGRKVVMGAQVPLWFETSASGVKRSWHFDCYRAAAA